MKGNGIPLISKVYTLHYRVQTYWKGVTVHAQKHFLFKPNFPLASPGNATRAQLIFAFGLKDWILEEANLILEKTCIFYTR